MLRRALASRHQDLTDLGYLISAASDADLDEARASAAMIEEAKPGNKPGSGGFARFTRSTTTYRICDYLLGGCFL